MKRRCLTVLICFICIGCNQKVDHPSIQEMLFEVNPDLLGEKTVLDSLGIAFHPPVAWNPVPDSLFEQFKTHIQDNADPEASFRLSPVEIFLNPASQSMLSVSTIEVKNEKPLSQLADAIQKQTRFDQGGRKLQRNCYIKDNIMIEQLFIQDALRVVIKLVFQNQQNQSIEMDYTTLKTIYQKESKAIESSLGTLIYVNN